MERINKPLVEEIPFKLCLTPQGITKFKSIIKFDTLEENEKIAWIKIFNPIPHRHLGLHSELCADTSLSSENSIAKIKERIESLHLKYMKPTSQNKCVNMLCNSMHSYSPLQSNFQFADTATLKIPKKLRNCFLIHVLFLMKRLPCCSYEKIGKHGQRMF